MYLQVRFRFLAAILLPGCVLGPSMMLDVFQYTCAHRGPAALPDEQNLALKKMIIIKMKSLAFEAKLRVKKGV